MQKLKNLVIPGIAGILLACAIFSAFVMAPWSGLLTAPSAPTPPSQWQLPPASPINIGLVLSNFTELYGLGSQANLTITVISNTSLSNVVVEIDISKGQWGWNSTGIKIIEGETLWIGNMTAEMPITWTIRINATEVGYGIIKATARWDDYWTYRSPDKSLGIVVLENEIQVVKPIHLNELQSIIPPIPAPWFEPSIWPSPDINSTLPYP